ncbi:HBS1-like protein [Lobulomyces angularis]|nr:HBS1-like protein [Lobulomyces angularis]
MTEETISLINQIFKVKEVVGRILSDQTIQMALKEFEYDVEKATQINNTANEDNCASLNAEIVNEYSFTHSPAYCILKISNLSSNLPIQNNKKRLHYAYTKNELVPKCKKIERKKEITNAAADNEKVDFSKFNFLSFQYFLINMVTALKLNPASREPVYPESSLNVISESIRNSNVPLNSPLPNVDLGSVPSSKINCNSTTSNNISPEINLSIPLSASATLSDIRTSKFDSGLGSRSGLGIDIAQNDESVLPIFGLENLSSAFSLPSAGLSNKLLLNLELPTGLGNLSVNNSSTLGFGFNDVSSTSSLSTSKIEPFEFGLGKLLSTKPLCEFQDGNLLPGKLSSGFQLDSLSSALPLLSETEPTMSQVVDSETATCEGSGGLSAKPQVMVPGLGSLYHQNESLHQQQISENNNSTLDKFSSFVENVNSLNVKLINNSLGSKFSETSLVKNSAVENKLDTLPLLKTFTDFADFCFSHNFSFIFASPVKFSLKNDFSLNSDDLTGEVNFLKEERNITKLKVLGLTKFSKEWNNKIEFLPNVTKHNFKKEIKGVTNDSNAPNSDNFKTKNFSSLEHTVLKAFQFDLPSPDDIINCARSEGKESSAQLKSAIPFRDLGVKKIDNLAVKSEMLNNNLNKSTTVDSKVVKHSTSTHNESSKKKEELKSKTNKERKAIVTSDDSTVKISKCAKKNKEEASVPSPNRLKTFKKLINVEQEIEKLKATGEKAGINLVVVGHVNSGKSTMLGHLLCLVGQINKSDQKKCAIDAEKAKKPSHKLAWLLDSTKMEREYGFTVHYTTTSFQTEKLKVTVFDTPGYQDFTQDVICALSQACLFGDVALLVVDSYNEDAAVPFTLNSQTKEHALLIRSSGITQIIVAVNKLEVAAWSQKKFEDVKDSVASFLVTAGFPRHLIYFIPISGFLGENLVEAKNPLLKSWYSGPTLHQQINQLKAPNRLIQNKFRMSITDIYKISSSNTAKVCGKILTGIVQSGDTVLIQPADFRIIVKAIEVEAEDTKWAAAGDVVTLSFINCDLDLFSIGNILCDPMVPLPVTFHFKARIVTFDLKHPLIGDHLFLIRGCSRMECRLSRLISIIDKSSGKVIKKNPRFLQKNQAAIVEILIVNNVICANTFNLSKELGRVILLRGVEW